MNIAIITSGLLPVPAVRGGAVENLIDFYLDYNERCLSHTVTVFSSYDKKLEQANLSHYHQTKFVYLHTQCVSYKLECLLFKYLNRDFYYHYLLDFFVHKLKRFIKHKPYDVVVVENRPGFAPVVATATNAPIVLHLHNDTLYGGVMKAKSVLDSCAGIITVSEYVRQRVLTISDVPQKVKVVYNGIDLDCFRQKENSNTSKRAALGFEEDDFVVVYTGRLDPLKGIRELLEAFSFLNKQKGCEKIKLLIIGSSSFGASGGDPFLEKMKQLSHSLSDKVVFTGFVPYAEIPSFLSVCDMGVVPSICEDALTMSSLEDMAMGLPLLVTRSGGIPEAVDSQCALIVEKDERLSVSLSEQIRWLYQNPQKRQQMAIHAQERASGFGKDAYADCFFRALSAFID